MANQDLSISSFGKGDDLAAQAFRDIWRAKAGSIPVKFAKSFLSEAPDSFIDFVIEHVEENAETLKTWPPGAILELGINGDRGAFCEPDTRSVVLTLEVGVGDEVKKYSTSCSMASFRKAYTDNFHRVSRLVSML